MEKIKERLRKVIEELKFGEQRVLSDECTIGASIKGENSLSSMEGSFFRDVNFGSKFGSEFWKGNFGKIVREKFLDRSEFSRKSSRRCNFSIRTR